MADGVEAAIGATNKTHLFLVIGAEAKEMRAHVRRKEGKWRKED